MEALTQAPSEIEVLQQKIDDLTEQVSFLAERQRSLAELLDDMAPVLKQSLKVGGENLQALEERGYFAVGRELLQLTDRVVTGFEPEDVRLLGENVVTILDTVRNLTQPKMLEVANEASSALQLTDQTQPKGVLDMLRASRDEDVQVGVAVLLEVLRQVGRSTRKASRNDKLRRMIGSKKQTRPRRASAQRRGTTRAPAPPPASTAAPTPPRVPGPQIDPALATVASFDHEGFLTDPETWTRELGEAIAASMGITKLEPDHQTAIEYARRVWTDTGSSPNLRQVAKGTGLGTKRLYQLFPKAPGKCTARIAGIPKPAGCI
jgi:tRNA 2-thiouridine synthesizing protein E